MVEKNSPAVVSVLIPSIPERAKMLVEAGRSVDAQTIAVVTEQIVYVDEQRRGCAYAVNRCAEKANGDWLFILADDDLMLPACLEVHLAASAEADIVYSPPLVWGVNVDTGAYRGQPPAIPSASLIRTELWRSLGGYNEQLGREEDRDLYIRALAAGARFVRADSAPTWVYRLHLGSKSLRPWTDEERALADRTYG